MLGFDLCTNKAFLRVEKHVNWRKYTVILSIESYIINIYKTLHNIFQGYCGSFEPFSTYDDAVWIIVKWNLS